MSLLESTSWLIQGEIADSLPCCNRPSNCSQGSRVSRRLLYRAYAYPPVRTASRQRATVVWQVNGHAASRPHTEEAAITGLAAGPQTSVVDWLFAFLNAKRPVRTWSVTSKTAMGRPWTRFEQDVSTQRLHRIPRHERSGPGLPTGGQPERSSTKRCSAVRQRS